MTTPWAIFADITGLLAWYLLIADILIGAMFAGSHAKELIPAKRRLRAHRIVGYVLAGMIAAHIAGIIAGRATIRLRLAPVAASLSTVLLAVVLCSSIAAVKKRLPRKLWARLHRLAFLALFAGTVHAIAAGPDNTSLWMLLSGVSALTLLAAIYGTRKYHVYAAKQLWWKHWRREVKKAKRVKS